MRVTLYYDNDAHDNLLKVIFDKFAGTVDTNRLPRIELDILKNVGWSSVHSQVFSLGFLEMFRDIRGDYEPYSPEETDLIKDVLRGYCLEFTEETIKDTCSNENK